MTTSLTPTAQITPRHLEVWYLVWGQLCVGTNCHDSTTHLIGHSSEMKKKNGGRGGSEGSPGSCPLLMNFNTNHCNSS